MPINLQIKIDTSAAQRMLRDVADKQIAFATARALTSVAKLAVADLQTEMKSAFAAPSNFTLNALYAKPSTRSDPTASVNSRDYAPKGRPAIKYLAPQIYGGARAMKGFEKALGPQSGEQFIVPATGQVISRGEIVRILSQLNALADRNQNISERTSRRLRKRGLTVAVTGHRSQYFVAHEKGDANGTPIGIWKIVGPGNVQKVMTFLPTAPNYSIRLPVERIVRATINRTVNAEFAKALAAALATARK